MLQVVGLAALISPHSLRLRTGLDWIKERLSLCSAANVHLLRTRAALLVSLHTLKETAELGTLAGHHHAACPTAASTRLELIDYQIFRLCCYNR